MLVLCVMMYMIHYAGSLCHVIHYAGSLCHVIHYAGSLCHDVRDTLCWFSVS